MKEDEVRTRIEEACRLLYAEHKLLVDTEANERGTVAHLAGYLRLLFDEWEVDTEYNRQGRGRGG
jgi:hypothetical protein